MSRRYLTLFFAAFALFVHPAPASAWGNQGHRMIADIATDHLTQQARQSLRGLLGDNDLASISTWADDIRNARPETKSWHYANIPWTAGGYSAARDCPGGDCVVAKINLFAAVLADPHRPLADRQEALKFLVHFVGDVHQPFHAIADARGGNDIPVTVFGARQCGAHACELHGAWDTDLIRHAGLREREYVRRLEAMIASDGIEPGAEAPEHWANESFQLAKGAWVNPGEDLDQAYYDWERLVMDRQLALAGLRLARMLNAALGAIEPVAP